MAVRTAIGDYGGHLKDVPPTQLAAGVVAEAVKRANIEAAVVGHVVFGNVIHTEPIDIHLSRVAVIGHDCGEHCGARRLAATSPG